MIITLIIVLILLTVIAIFIFRHIHQARARADADRIINGKQSANVEQLNKIITTLQTADSFLQKIAEGDYWRVHRLRMMRTEMMSPHP